MIHLAAKKAVGESMTNPEKYALNNIAGAINVLNAMSQNNVRMLVFSSSAAVYGEPQYLPVDEEHPLNPVSFYGFTKYDMERYFQWYDRLKGLKFVSLRYFNAAGADPEGECGECHQPETHLIPRVFMGMTGDIGDFRIMGDDYPTPDGTCIRDYIHVSDLASAHVLAVERLCKGMDGEGQSLNLGTGTGISVREILTTAERITGHHLHYTVGSRRAVGTTLLC